MTAGEEWAAAELAQLRAQWRSPRAAVRFLVASSERARAVARERPGLARQAHAWEATGASAYVLRPVPGAGPWWALVSLMLDWHLGMVESETGEPRPLGAADALTLGRAWLAPLVLADFGPGTLALAFATDALDGVVARTGVPTRAGRDLEGLADAAIIVAALIAARRRDALGAPVVALELVRVGAGFGYAVGVYFARAQPPPSWVLRAGRLAAPVRAAGLVAAASGRRRPADVLVTVGSATSLAGLIAAASSRRPGG